MLCSFQLSEDEVEMQFITSHRGIVSKTNCHQHMKQTISMVDILVLTFVSLLLLIFY
jgi:hypothetical protein